MLQKLKIVNPTYYRLCHKLKDAAASQTNSYFSKCCNRRWSLLDNNESFGNKSEIITLQE
jgi:hypothetical protein